jgi:hypothetical protein
MAQNVWVRALDGRLIRVERVTELGIGDFDGWGWTVFAELGRGEPAPLADVGRGPRAKRGAQRLCNEWPQATEAAVKGETIRFMKDGYPKGEGRWSTLADPPAPPVETRPRQRRPGTGAG